MTNGTRDRAPAAFDLTDPRVELEASPPEDAAAPEPPLPKQTSERRRTGWGALFFSAVGGLILLSLFVWAKDTVAALLARSDWLGWAAVALFAVAALAFVMIVGREITGLLRLSAITALRRESEAAMAADDALKAISAARRISDLFHERRELSAGLKRLRKSRGDILDAKQVLILAERELLLPLDRRARAIVGGSGRRVSVMTSLSPAAVFAVGFVAYENFRMLRSLASVYGGRPGLLAILRLMRMIAGHLAVTGGIAFTDDLLQQVIGHGLTARLSRRLGEGLVNGGFTIRIGLAAIDVLRPLPYIEARRPRLREFVSEFLKVGTRTQPDNES